MNVVFDIDETIVDETKYILKHAPKYLKKKFKRNFDLVNINGNGVAEKYGVKEYFLEKGLSLEDAEKQAKKVSSKFWSQPINFIRYTYEPIKPGVKETIKELIKDGHDVSIATLRGVKTTSNPTKISEFIRLKVVPFLTRNQLKRNGILYHELKLVENYEGKYEYFDYVKADIIIDDQPEVIQKESEKRKVICIPSPHNKKYEFNDNVVTFSHFENYSMNDYINKLESLKKIPESNLSKKTADNHKKTTNALFYKHALTNGVYKLVINIGKRTLLKKIKPLVVGRENVPYDNRSVVFVGNHRRVFDPVLISITNNRVINWAALLRMFQGKESLFSTTKNPIKLWLSSLIIYLLGAIPIARRTDENFIKINEKSFDEINQYLQWGGSLGIFPEATLNRKPEEQNILPVKSMRSFKFALENKSWVEPVSIVWVPDMAKIENKTIIKYDKPVNINGLTLIEVCKKWIDVTNQNIDEINAIVDELIKTEQNPDKSNLEKETEKQRILSKLK